MFQIKETPAVRRKRSVTVIKKISSTDHGHLRIRLLNKVWALILRLNGHYGLYHLFFIDTILAIKSFLMLCLTRLVANSQKCSGSESY